MPHPRPDVYSTKKNACRQCGEVHHADGGMAYCECGACLYKHGTQKGIPQEELEKYPFIKCELCGKVNFWD